jgi:hypothetical protein
MDKKILVESYRSKAKSLNDEELAIVKRAVNRQLAFGKIGEEFNHDAIAAFAVAEVLQREQYSRLRD